MRPSNEVAAIAAITICESLILALIDNKLLSEAELQEVLAGAAEAHRNTAERSADPELHRAVAELIGQIADGRDSVRLFG